MTPLLCAACSAPVPLCDAATIPCPSCGHVFALPSNYRHLFVVHAREIATRRAAEAEFTVLAREPSAKIARLAALLVLFLPACAGTSVVYLLDAVHDHMSTPALVAAILVPALVPGTGVWLWKASIEVTLVRFRLALAAARDRGMPACRSCGAPLTIAPEDIAATCLYCGTDSIITDIASTERRLDTALKSELRTLAQANEVLRLRRRLLDIGAVAASVLLFGFSLVVWIVYQRVQ